MFVSNGAPNEAMARCSTAPSVGRVTADYRTEGWRPVTFDAMWRAAVEADPRALFLRFENTHGAVNEWTYEEFDRVIEGAANRLAAAGVGDGSSVHLALTNSPAFVAVWLAAVRLGAWIVPSDPMATTPELGEHLVRTSPVVGFCAAERAETYRNAGSLPTTVIEIDESDVSFDWLTRGSPRSRPRPALGDRAAVMFTSGTTGRPKGVEITQANYAFAGATMAAACDLAADDCYLVVLPLFHANAQYYSFAAAIAAGASVALMPTFSASRFVDQAARHGATCASLFAGPIRMILARGGPAAPDLPPLRLRHCWYAQNLTPAQYDTIASWLGCRPRQLYGMTETIPAVLTDERDTPACDTMGYVTPGCRSISTTARSSSVANRASRCSPATSTIPSRPRPRSATAGSAPATAPTATSTAASSSTVATRTSSRSPARTCRSSRSNRSSPCTHWSPTSPWSAHRIRSVTRSPSP